MTAKEKEKAKTLPHHLPVLALGFRPFFLLAGIAALALVFVWVYAFSLGNLQAPFSKYFTAFQWHSHEMLFGYALAVFAGFLLTAVRNWTGVDTARFGRLLALVLLWLCGRIALWFGGVLPGWLIFIVDLAFPVLLSLHISWVIAKGGRPRNYQFWIWLSLVTIGNVLMHLGRSHGKGYFEAGWYMSFYAMLGILSVVAGRILPFFTERGLMRSEPFRRRPWLDHLALGSLFLAGISHYLYASGSLGNLGFKNAFRFFPGLAALVHGLRLGLAFDRRIFRLPLLWILHLGYAWLVFGMFFLQILVLEGRPSVYAIHALSTGAFGAFALGMMARVSLGHSGRPLQVSPWMKLSFAAMLLVPFFRSLMDFLFSQRHLLWIGIAAGLWFISFFIFLFVYIPVLVRPRADGRPG